MKNAGTLIQKGRLKKAAASTGRLCACRLIAESMHPP